MVQLQPFNQQNKRMLENLNRNGSFIQRRKMYVQFPFHNLASKVPIDWASDPHADLMRNPCRSQKVQEQAYLQRIYDQRISKKMMEKYKNSLDTFRVIPGQLALGKDRDALSMEVEQFNTSKVQQRVGRNQEEGKEIYGVGAYNSLKELPSQKYLNKHDATSRIAAQYNHQHQQIVENSQANPERLTLAQKYKDPYTAQRDFASDLMKQYRRSAQVPNSSQSQQFRSLLPDKLEEFLRQRQPTQRKSKLRASLSLSTRINP